MKEWNPIIQALVATLFTWLVTALGASIIFFKKGPSRRFLDGMLGFAAGVMIAASFWSLLLPAIEMAKGWIPAAVGFILGGIFLRIMDKVIPHLHLGFPIEEAEGPKTSIRKTMLLVLAMTLHNIPEGLAVGVAFGALGSGVSDATFMAAFYLALGIGIQNFPEGIAVAMPLKREGLSTANSFFLGQLSGLVEPIAGILGACLVSFATPLLPYALGFAAGAMIFVVVEEVIPEAQSGGNADTATAGTMIGFVVMMILDVALG